MKFKDSLKDFSQKSINIHAGKTHVFNRLLTKQTTLTTKSIIAYIKGDINDENYTITNIYISNNPSESLKKDEDILDDIDSILIHQVLDFENELLDTKKAQLLEDNMKRDIDEIKRFCNHYIVL